MSALSVPAGVSQIAAVAGQRADALVADAAGSASTRSPEQLRSLAAQFESLLMGQLLKTMQHSIFESEDEGSAGMGTGPLADALFAEVSLALSKSGGIGLGASLLGPLTKEAVSAPEATTPASNGPAGGVPTRLRDVPAAAFTPMPGRVSSGYGWRRDPINGEARFHHGIDLALPIGEDVPVARQGTVASTGEIPGYGLTVVVQHDERTATRYAHLSEILVKPGDRVESGATIAKSGATGRVTGPHLHVEVLEAGQPVDPSAIKVRRRVAD